MRNNRNGQTDVRAMGCIVQLIVMVVVFVILALVGGSFRTEVTYSPHPATQGRAVPFNETFTARHWLVGLIKGEQPDLHKALAKYTAGGDEVGEITINTRHTLGNCFVSCITLGIYSPMTVTVSGQVVAAQSPGPKNMAVVTSQTPGPAAASEEPKPEKEPEPLAKSSFPTDRPPGEPRPPEETEARTWTDATAKYRVEAEFVSFANDMVRLKKADGKIIDLPLERLSKEDQQWVRDRHE